MGNSFPGVNIRNMEAAKTFSPVGEKKREEKKKARDRVILNCHYTLTT